MAVPLLDLKAQYTTIRDSVVNAMMKVVEDQAFILGEPVERLEREVAQLSHATHAIGCANGTDAILLALRALDIGRGDEVLTTPFTFFATAGAVHNVGARPVFADINPDTFNLSGDSIAESIKPSTRAVIAVDLFGQMAPIEAIMDAAGDTPVIEDAAQSIGAIWPNRSTAMTARVDGLMLSEIESPERLNVSGSMSANTGRAPTL